MNRDSAIKFGASIAVVVALFVILYWPAIASIRWSFIAPHAAIDPDSAPVPGMSRQAWTRPIGLGRTTIELVGLVELIAVPIGVALAFALYRTDAFGTRYLIALLILDAFIPTPLHATAWLGAFGNVGRAQAIGSRPILTGLWGAAIVHATAAIPWIVVIAGLGFRSVERELEELALLDRPGLSVAFAVTLRRAASALAAAALAVAVLVAGDMTVTDLLSLRTYAEESYLQFQMGDDAAAASVSLPPFLCLGILIFLGGRRVLAAEPERLPSVDRSARTWRLGAWRFPVGLIAAFVVLFLTAVPIGTLVWRAGRVGGNAAAGIAPHWSVEGFVQTIKDSNGDMIDPLKTSVVLCGSGAAIAVVVAWAIAWGSRSSRFWRIGAAVSLALAFAAPGPVAGSAIVVAYRDIALIYDNPVIMILAYAARSFPYAFLTLWPAVRGLPEAYFDVARVSGLGSVESVWRIAIPLTRGSIALAWCVAFIVSLGELPASHLVEVPGYTTLAKRIWELLHTGVESRLAGSALVYLAFLAFCGTICLFIIKNKIIYKKYYA
jgi:iron(III) transport system permease protein